MNTFFERSGALLGEEAMARLAAARVLVVGVGGVGSWCAEALARTGIGALTLVDDDVVQPSNDNRQCPATAAAIGRPKVEAMRERILAVNPACEVEARCERYAAGGDRRSQSSGAGPRTAPKTSSLDAAFSSLGITPDSSFEDARKAYREKAKQYHPDRLRAQGLPEGLVEKATQRMAELNSAWDEIRKAKGWQ